MNPICDKEHRLDGRQAFRSMVVNGVFDRLLLVIFYCVATGLIILPCSVYPGNCDLTPVDRKTSSQAM